MLIDGRDSSPLDKCSVCLYENAMFLAKRYIMAFAIGLCFMTSPVLADEESRALADAVEARLAAALIDTDYQITRICDENDCSLIVE